jgi:hypothetical protein
MYSAALITAGRYCVSSKQSAHEDDSRVRMKRIDSTATFIQPSVCVCVCVCVCLVLSCKKFKKKFEFSRCQVKN